MRLAQPDSNNEDAANRKLQKDQGYTLIEVLIALSVFAFGLLAVAAMQTTSIKVNSTAGQITERITWAQDKLEELMALPYSDPWLEDLGDPPEGTDSAGNEHQETTPDGFTISWTVTDDNPLPSTKLITVTVTGRGRTTRLGFIKPDVES